jgi:hypothetical protein
MDLVIQDALDYLNFGKESWKPDLRLVRTCYEADPLNRMQFLLHREGRVEPSFFPLAIADEIVSNPAAYPGFLLTPSEERCRQEVATKIVPVAQVAAQEKWFVSS